MYIFTEMSFTFVYLLCFSLSFLFRFVSFIFLCVLSTIQRYIFSTERKNKCINVTEVPYVKSQNEHFIYIQHDRHISFIIFLIFYSFFVVVVVLILLFLLISLCFLWIIRFSTEMWGENILLGILWSVKTFLYSIYSWWTDGYCVIMIIII